MFRKRTRFARPFRRPFRTARRFGHKPGFARKKFDWITLFDTVSTGSGDQGCGWATASPCGFSTSDCAQATTGVPKCCNTIITVELMSQATLQSFFQDRVTIHRLVGEIYYQESVNLPIGAQRCLPSTGAITFVDPEQYALRYASALELGIRKDSAADDPSDTDVISPGDIFERTETFWYWRRNRLWHPRLSRTHGNLQQGFPYAVCANTSQASYVVPAEASGSQPTYTVPAESTTCTQWSVDPGENCVAQYDEYHYQEPPLMHWKLRLKRHILMRRDDRLHLQIQVQHPPRIGWTDGWNCNSTFLNEGWTSNLKVRVNALVRLN